VGCRNLIAFHSKPTTIAFDRDVAVTTSNGGGSPRNVPRQIAPEIHSPATGNALYVFALPERR